MTNFMILMLAGSFFCTTIYFYIKEYKKEKS
ncbi:putative membrane protein [Bacillus atrophaeus subsp. globigii]|uniref:Phage protein n=1 Tax=Bacillus atrophaeus (strain 1942) TaxID=720555 RepID=A0ABN3ZDF6_BACA1|nr:hypothetical protein BATR1942_16160 [Bacillus atrophaeus 1942]AIK46403.1 putative membrane protein [Bacillus atrophaeus subsp. globigii]ARW08596.1 hypothetical protein S101359_03618 [Bacillus atrophaeus]EIM11169.1 hypothetical protein UY9_08690 [Bacillus atrophaeus C89]KFK84474.1 putative membrane protein [Bacillus atrophaeus]